MTNRVGEPFEYPHQNDDGYIVDQSRVKGADQTVANLTARNRIFTSVRSEGMQVRVLDADGSGNEKTYQLGSGLTNADWTEVVGGGGGQQPGGASYFRDLRDLRKTPRQYQGTLRGRAPLAVLQHGVADPVNTPDAIKYITAPDISVFEQPVAKMFFDNKGYGGANTEYRDVDAGLRVNPAGANPAVIYMNQEGIGDPSTAPNDEAHNSVLLAESTLVLRAARRPGAPVWQRYQIEYHGQTRNGTAISTSHIQDFYSLVEGASGYKSYLFEIPAHSVSGAMAFINRIEISKVAGDQKSQNSAGLLIQSASIKSTAWSMGGLTVAEVESIRDANLDQRGAFKADIVVKTSDSNYDIAGHDTFIFFALQAQFGKLTGLTAAQQQSLGAGGLVRADAINGRWEVLSDEVMMTNALIAEGNRANIYHYRGGSDLRVIAPRRLDGLEDTDTSTIQDPDNLSVLKYYKVPSGARGFWVGQSSPFDTYTRNNTSFEDAGQVAKRVVVVAGTQPNAGTPGFTTASYKLDVRRDTVVTTYFDNLKRDVLMYNPNFALTLGVWLKGVTGGEAFKYNVKAIGKDVNEAPFEQDLVFEGTLGLNPEWYSIELDVRMKKLNRLVWTDASTGAGDLDVSRYARLIKAGVYNPDILRTLPGIELGDPGEY